MLFVLLESPVPSAFYEHLTYFNIISNVFFFFIVWQFLSHTSAVLLFIMFYAECSIQNALYRMRYTDLSDTYLLL